MRVVPAKPSHLRAQPGPWLWEDHPVRVFVLRAPELQRPRVHPRWHDAGYWQQQAAEAARTCPVCDGDGGYLDRPWRLATGHAVGWTVCLACGGSGQRGKR